MIPFNVLVEVADSDFDGLTIRAGGRMWTLQEHELIDGDLQYLDYICVSYTWGTGRIASPLLRNHSISDRTIDVLATVVTLRPECKRIWIDALCLPQHPDSLRQSLESMGYIYSQAREVIAVLFPSTGPVMEKMKREKELDPDHVQELENDTWVTRAWTYQEAVNARSLYMTYEGAEDFILPADELLNYVGFAISRLKKRINVSTTEAATTIYARYPRLDAIEDLCDYLIASYCERSALQIMAMMCKRDINTTDEYFYAMIGALTQARASDAETTQSKEAFMRLCERKGDFSFIFSMGPRSCPDLASVQSFKCIWRPSSDTGELCPILPLQVHGPGQPGRIEADGRLTLHSMTKLTNLDLAPLGVEARQMFEAWLRKGVIRDSPFSYDLEAQEVYSRLHAFGFRGCVKPLSFKQGLVYLTNSFSTDQTMSQSENFESCFISNTLRYTFGAPVLGCFKSCISKNCGQPSHSTYVAGIFVGPTRGLKTDTFTIG